MQIGNKLGRILRKNVPASSAFLDSKSRSAERVPCCWSTSSTTDATENSNAPSAAAIPNTDFSRSALELQKFSWRRLGNFMWLLTSEPDCRARVLKRERSREKEKWKREIAKVGSFYCCVVEVTLPLLLCSFSLSPYTLSFPLYTLNLSFPSSLRSCRLGPLLRCLALKSSSGARAFIFLTVSSIFLFPRRIHSISILCINFEK